MYFRLAETFGVPISEVLDRVSSAEITEWMAYFKMQGEEAERER